METIRDCKGRICCVGDPVTGYVENKYKGQEATTYLAVPVSPVSRHIAMTDDDASKVRRLAKTLVA